MKILGRGRKKCLKGLNWTFLWLKRTIGGGKGLFLVWKDYWWWRRTIVEMEKYGKWKILENGKYGKWKILEKGRYLALALALEKKYKEK